MVDEEKDNRLSLARAWYKAKEALDEAKKVEMELRMESISAFFGEEEKGGSVKEKLNEGSSLVLTRSKKVSIDLEAFKEHEAHLKAKGLIGDDSVIRMEPKVSMTALRQMSAEDKVLFSDVFIHGLNSPQLKVEIK